MKGFIAIIILFGSIFFVNGCKTIHDGELYEPIFKSVETHVALETAADPQVTEMEPAGIITIDEVLDVVLKINPGLESARHNVEAFDGVIKQAGSLPNPSLTGEIEEFAGSGEFSGTGAMSSRIGISQEIPIAGQPSKRISVARVQKSLAESEYSARLIALRTEVKKRFLRVYILQEQLKLEEENLDILRSLKESAVKRVTAGEVSPLEEIKVTVQLESAEIAFERRKRELEGGRYVLASSWAGESPQFEQVKYRSEEDFSMPDEKKLLEQIRLNPKYSILDKNVQLASSNLDLARSEAWMDIEVGGGIQRFKETDDHAYFIEVSIPLPIFNRNKGNIKEAIHIQSKAKKEFEAGLIELRTGLRELFRRLHSVQKAYISMQNTVMPAAEKAFESVRKAYDAGEEDYIELLEAQRTHLETRREHLEMFNEFQELRIEIEGLTAEGDKEK